MRNLQSYEDFLILEKSRVVDFFRQNRELLSQWSKGLVPKTKSEWSPRSAGLIKSGGESPLIKRAKERLLSRIESIRGADKPVDNSGKGMSRGEAIAGSEHWGDREYLIRDIEKSNSAQDWTKKMSIRWWKFPEESRVNHAEYSDFTDWISQNWQAIKKSIDGYIAAVAGIRGSGEAAFEKEMMKLGLSVRDVEVAMSYVNDWTSMSRKRLDSDVWPLLNNISVDPVMLPKTVYRGIFYDGAKIRDLDKWLKQWAPGARPGVSQGKATSWSSDRGTAAEFMRAQDFVKDEKGGYYVLLKWNVRPDQVIADLRNLPVDHAFWNQAEFIVDPAARDYVVDTIIPGSAGWESYNEFRNSIKSGEGGWGRSKSEYVLQYLAKPFDQLTPGQKMEMKAVSKMTVAEFVKAYPRSGINIGREGQFGPLAIPLAIFLDKLGQFISPVQIERNRLTWRWQMPLLAVQGLPDPVIKSTWEKVKKEADFNPFSGTDSVVSDTGLIELVNDDYFKQEILLKMPTECFIETTQTKTASESDKKSNAALVRILEEVGSARMIEVLSKRQTTQNYPRNMIVRVK